MSKHMKKIIEYFTLAALSAMGFCACANLDDAEYSSADELGAIKKEYVLEAQPEAMTIKDTINIYSNKDGKASLMDNKDSKWIRVCDETFKHNEGAATSMVRFEYTGNQSTPRMAKILLQTDTRQDTVSVFQKGVIDEIFEFPIQAVTTLSSERSFEVPVDVNIPIKDVEVKIVYQGPSGWISNDVKSTLSSDKFVVETLPNDSEDVIRRAQIFFSWTNGWGELLRRSVTVTQTGSNDKLGTEIAWTDLRDMATTVATPIEGDYILTGYVVSDNANGNAGECAMEVMNSIDYASNDVTVYMESLDGKYGVRILCKDAANNTFSRYSKVSLSLDGVSIARSGDDPERYTLSEVVSTMIMNAENVGAGNIPVKEKYIDELTDEDIYTYVTLKDCELPIRKGSLTPVNEGYTTLFGNNRVNKYPTLVRDIKGGSLYMFTNITCPYRRDGSILPYGSGKISGIIVHESYRQFVDQDNSVEDYCGKISRYQIRHLSREEIALDPDFNNGFSRLITEYRYIKLPTEGKELPEAACVDLVPTYGSNGSLTHTYTDYTSVLHCRATTFNSNFAYLGPCGKGTFNPDPTDPDENTPNGYGIILEDGTDYMGTNYYGTYGVSNADGKGACAANHYLAIENKYWWVKGVGQSWEINFSTKDYSSDQVSVQILTMNTAQANSLALPSPRYWRIEYSIDNKKTWKIVETFTVPDVAGWSNTMLSQSLGAKPINFRMPLEILGKDKVYVRLTVNKNKASEGGMTYDTGEIVNNSGCNSLQYFAVRCNK